MYSFSCSLCDLLAAKLLMQKNMKSVIYLTKNNLTVVIRHTSFGADTEHWKNISTHSNVGSIFPISLRALLLPTCIATGNQGNGFLAKPDVRLIGCRSVESFSDRRTIGMLGIGKY